MRKGADLLKSSIDYDSGPTLEERVMHNAKRLCAGFAIVAVTISGLDLMNIRPVEAAAEMIQESNLKVSAIPSAVVAGLRSVSLTGDEKSEIAVLIPRDPNAKIADRVASSMPASTASIARRSAPVVAGLAEARHEDAVEFAMSSPAPGLNLTPAPPPQPIQLASLGPTPLPSDIERPAAAPAPVTLPAVLSFLPPPAPGVPPPSPMERLHLEGKPLARAERCLANAIYFEARDQPYKGQVAVAQVVMNRVFSGFYPEDVCGVVYQNASHHLACQFTFACDGKRKNINERGAWARANRIARETLAGKLYEPAVGTATHYHAFYVRPTWVREMKKLARYGEHSFYRPIAWGNGSDEPVWSKLALKKKKETN
jgi:spore germination cell wall hydrolase CwlJ-like protein